MFNMVWQCTFSGKVFVFPHSPFATTTRSSVFCILSVITRLDIGQSANIWIEFHLRSLSCAFSRRSANQPAALLLDATHCWWDSTMSKLLSAVVILDFQFGLYHAVVPLSLLHNQSGLLPCYVSIFSWLDLLQILRTPVVILFAVSCIIAQDAWGRLRHTFGLIWEQVVYVLVSRGSMLKSRRAKGTNICFIHKFSSKARIASKMHQQHAR